MPAELPLREEPPPVPGDHQDPAAMPTAAQETTQIARTAGIISLGNIASRILGLIRQTVKSHFFGAGGAVDAFNVATIVPVMLYDLMIGGMVNSSLVPVFSEYAEDRREQLWTLVNILLSLSVVILAALVLVVELFAPQVAYLLSSGSSPEVLDLTARLLRITVPAVFFLSLSGILSGLLYALHRFTYPAFTAATFNAGIVAVTLLFHRQLDITAMALGLLIGSVLQVALLIPGLRDARLRFRLSLSHPGLKRIIALYTPIVLGLLVDILINRPISYNLASQTGEGGISWMGFATNLREMPQGLVATAISFAILPTLSAHMVAEQQGSDQERFQAALARGIRLVLVLIIPATVGLFILAHPTVALLFEHGDFVAIDTLMTAQALQYYLLGLPFAAVDLLLIMAFYARQDTLTPALIGVITTLIHLGVAVWLLPTWGLFALMIADSFKHLLHMVVSWAIMRRRIGGLSRHGVPYTLGLILVASAIMGGLSYGSLLAVERFSPVGGTLQELLLVSVPGVVGAASYLGLVLLFQVDEITLLWAAIRRRFGL